MAEPPHSEEETRLERAAHFLVSLLDDPSDVLREERDSWMSADPRNAVAFARVEAAWDRAAALRCMPPAPDHDDHWTRPSPDDQAPDAQQ